MDWVAEGIAIGSLSDAIDHDRIRAEGVEAVLQLYGHERERAPFPIPVAVLQLPVVDRQPLPLDLLDQGVAFMRAHREQGNPVLVTCGAGMSRSVVFVAAFLVEKGAGLVQALRQIRAARPQARPHRLLVRSLADRCDPVPDWEELAPFCR